MCVRLREEEEDGRKEMIECDEKAAECNNDYRRLDAFVNPRHQSVSKVQLGFAELSRCKPKEANNASPLLCRVNFMSA